MASKARSPGLESWMVEEIIRTLSDYKWLVKFEETYTDPRGTQRFACLIGNARHDYVIGRGATRFDALQAAYQHAGLGMYGRG